MKNITEANILPGLRVFVRIDMDVPFTGDKIEDTSRLDNSLETLKYITSKEALPIIAGHIGRPKGEFDENLSTNKILPYLNQNLGKDNFELLENLRFNPGEKENNENFAQELASTAEIYVNESFATSHREHASIVGVPSLLPAYAGLRLEKEVETLTNIINNPIEPIILIVGGAKIESKRPLIEAFISSASKILVGGKLGLDWEGDLPSNVLKPTDYARDNFDIGPETTQRYCQELDNAKTIIWAGPTGMFEEEEFFVSTKQIAERIAQVTTEGGCFSLVGGGDTVAAVKKAGVYDKISFVSTGGSAMLQYLADGTLPGIEALER